VHNGKIGDVDKEERSQQVDQGVSVKQGNHRQQVQQIEQYQQTPDIKTERQRLVGLGPP
jgi:hypothetical protein